MRKLKRLRKGTILYHGTHAKWAKVIEQEGKVRRVDHKTSGGTLDEGGLLWFTPELHLATKYAEGMEARGDDIRTGRVFSLKTTKPLVFIPRSYRLNQKEADALTELLGIPDYKALERGDSLNTAMNRTVNSGRKQFPRYGEMLALWPTVINYFGVDGMVYQDVHFAIPADEVEVR